MSCRKTRDWLHRGADSLDEAQRLLLDDHLAACERCRGDRARMRLLHGVGTSLPAPPPGDRLYSRAIARALLEGGARAEIRARPRRWALSFAAIAAAAATAAAAGIAIRRDEPTPAAAPAHGGAAPAPAPDRPRGGRGVEVRPPAEPEPTPAPAPTQQIESGAPRTRAAPDRPSRPARPSTRRDAGAPSAAQLLAEARARFAARDYPAAERAAQGALASAPSRPQAAEAHTLLADIAQAGGDLALAVTRYTGVAAKFAELPAAESALYAAARVELRRARRAEARALLTQYLDRYPSGRYAGDVRRQLTSSP